jgi:hypothetical protein
LSRVLIDLGYFAREVRAFREIMCDRRNTIERIDRAFQGLFYVFIRGTATGDEVQRGIVSDADLEQAQRFWDATSEEWTRRSAIMIMAGHPIGGES